MNFIDISLECFLAIAESGNFTKAGEKIGRTQSAISQQILKLENLLGAKLLTRGKEITLTPKGDILLFFAQRMASLNREMIDHFREPDLQGEIRFGVPEDFATFFMAEVLAEFSREHPLVSLNVECDLTLNLFKRFKKGEFDIVLIKMACPKGFPHGVSIFKEPLEWVEREGLVDTLDAEKVVPLVLSPQPCVYRACALEALEKAKIKWRIVYTSPSYAGAIAAVKAGMGLTVLPRNMIPKSLRYIDKRRFPALNDIHISLLKNITDNVPLNSFEKFLLKRIKY